ncbi:glycosyltransferase [Microbacterium sp. 2FI]|uniref:glycosyltransferase n=1 Tax=Microbacterium sp. 2FI TaxID=2502193 RepID=UPI0010F44860|nr:glycosyltransferase [Microbacterium sp. 2FI]
MTETIRVLSLYEGFFAGGARILHTDVVAGLHATSTQRHSVLSIAAEAHRESTRQLMGDDPRYQRLVDAGIGVSTLGRTATGVPPARSSFTEFELLLAADAVRRADVILSLKEQPLGLLLALRDHGLMPDIPVAACLHRSDPDHSGPALDWLAEAAHTGLVTATISCARSTSEAYARAVAPSTRRLVIPNGIDTARFRPGTRAEKVAMRRSLGIPQRAPVVVYAARFDDMKNPELFLRAVAEHSLRQPDTHYVACGAGMTMDNDRFRHLVHASGIRRAENLHALGVRDDMPAVYGIADIVALTSAFGEASPLCLIEGAACGATPVTTDVGDAAAIVDGIGFVTPHDATAVSQAWERVLAGRSGLRRAAVGARRRLGRETMITGYGDAIGELIRREAIAA